jgi:hypothetical protein
MKRHVFLHCAAVWTAVVLCGPLVARAAVVGAEETGTGTGIDRQIAQELQKIRAAGEPASIDELIRDDIPDRENGALVYAQAFELLKQLKEKHKEEWKSFPYEGGTAWKDVPQAEKENVKALLLGDSEFAKFYQLLEKAAGMRCRFLTRQDYEKAAELMLADLAQLRSCARMLAARADIRAEEAQVDSALRDCITCLRTAGAVADEPLLISGLVRIAIDAIALARLEHIVPKGDADPATYRALIAELARECDAGIVYHSLVGERVILGIPGFARMGRAVPPGFLKEQELTYLRVMARFIALAWRPYSAAWDKMAALNDEVAKLPAEKAALTQQLPAAIGRAALQEARLDAQLGAAELGLACRLHRMQHTTYPVSLRDLSPAYLPALPLDPFTGRGYVYRRAGQGFKVYSLGENLKDDGGTRATGTTGARDWTRGDIVWQE